MKRLPKTVYFNSLNGYGLHYKEPLKLIWQDGWYLPEDHENSDIDELFDYYKEGSRFGYFESDDKCYRYYVSPIKKDVEMWTKGARAVIKQLKNFTKD